MGDRILEAAVESVEQAVAAEQAGATRVELSVRLDVGGTTPPDSLIEAVVGAVSLPVFVLIRPRAGDFLYTSSERAEMRRSIAVTRAAGAHGIAIGLLRADRQVDRDATRAMIDAAGGLAVTFHRAFDETPDLLRALDDVVATGASRVLTAGGAATALDGASMLSALHLRAGEQITIIAAGGIRAHNAATILARAPVREVHARFEDAARTRQLVDLL